MKIGFIGLGIMGAPMAGHIIDGGHVVTTSTHHREPPQWLVEKGLTAAASPAAMAEQSEIVILMLPDTPQVESVLLGQNGIIQGLSRGTLIIDMSSISPLATQKFASTVRDAGGEYLDAPVSGGEVGAKSASLSIMVGGTEEAFARAKPILDLVGKKITLVGDVGHGQIAKVANQIIVALNIEAVAEALVFASKAGADPEKVRQALIGGFASSRILDVHADRMIKRTFDPGFRIRLHQKDLNLALESARALGVMLPNTATAQELLNGCVAYGEGDLDHSALVRALERAAHHTIAP
jgi:2-hydroxy-3-oxopropionate reductase